ncbi:rod-binding protein [Pseudaeromonas sharmana]|uniref:Rod-binding protein n=1 Tax=Pseudaeromonas sharmana TaxID=328412 RepID=A0ABV8CMX7_9GAMM
MSQRIEGIGASEPAFYDDFSGLQAIKRQPDGLEAAASQFEVQFLQTVLKHMRAASDALQDEESLFSSQQQGFYRDLYDSQLAMSMVHKGGLGLKEQIVAQVAPTLKNSDNSVAVPQHGSESFRQSLHQVKRKPD